MLWLSRLVSTWIQLLSLSFALNSRNTFKKSTDRVLYAEKLMYHVDSIVAISFYICVRTWDVYKTKFTLIFTKWKYPFIHQLWVINCEKHLTWFHYFFPPAFWPIVRKHRNFSTNTQNAADFFYLLFGRCKQCNGSAICASCQQV